MNRPERLARDGVEGEPILFYDARESEWGIFSNFSRHGVWMPQPFTGELAYYGTTEHRYQAMKAPHSQAHEEIRKQPNPSKAKWAGGPRSRVPGMVLRDGWGSNYGDLCWYAMFECVLAKATQHDDMIAALQESEQRHIYEDSPTDDIWGWRFESDYRGKNLLGRVLMQVRDVVC